MRSALIILLGTNYRSQLSRGSYASTDQARDLYFPTILNQHIMPSQPPMAWVMHCHMYPTRPVTSIMETFDIVAVIQTRNILDTLVSYINMLDKAEAGGGRISNDFLLQAGKPFSDMSAEERRFALVNVAPLWYARFYGKWFAYTRECEAAGRPAPLWVKFSQLEHEPEALLAEITRHTDPAHTYTDDQVKAALARAMSDKEAVRFNKGVSGRGQDYFTQAEKDTIYGLMRSAGEEDLVRMEIL